MFAVCCLATIVLPIVLGSCDGCYQAGTVACKDSICHCRSGFTGTYCNACAARHYGAHCSPILHCCRGKIESSMYGALFSDKSKDTAHKTVKRSRRQAQMIEAQHCEYRRELCNVEEIITDLYQAIQLTPPVDDLSPFLEDIHERQTEILRLIAQINKHLENDPAGAFEKFKDDMNNNLVDIQQKLSELETEFIGKNDNLIDKLMSVGILIDAQKNYSSTHDTIEPYIETIAYEGIRLERNTTAFFNSVRRLDRKTKDFTKDEEKIIPALEKIHAAVAAEVNATCEECPECETHEDCNNYLASDLKRWIEKCHERLPHGYPNILEPWFDDANTIQNVINNSLKITSVTLNKINEAYEMMRNKADSLSDEYKIVQQWLNDVIDLRELIIYVDVLEEMASKPLYGQTNQLSNLKDHPLLMSDMSVLVQCSQIQADALDKSYNKTNDKLEQAETVTESTDRNIEKYDINVADINETLQTLNDAINFKSATAKLEADANVANEKAKNAQETMNTLADDLDEINQKKQNANKKRRKRNQLPKKVQKRKKRQLKRTKRKEKAKRHRRAKQVPSERNEQIERIKILTNNVMQLQNEIEEYRHNQSDINYKTYLDGILAAQQDNVIIERDINKLVPNCGDECSLRTLTTTEEMENKYKKIENHVKNEINIIKENIRSTTAKIYQKIAC